MPSSKIDEIINEIVWYMCIVVIMVGIIGGMLGAVFIQDECRCETSELVGLEDRVGGEGRFFLIWGSIDQKPYYVLYRKKGKAIVLDKVQAENAEIYEEERDDAVMERCFLVKKFKIQIPPASIDLKHCKVKFRVPKGTIKRVYNLDLKN